MYTVASYGGLGCRVTLKPIPYIDPNTFKFEDPPTVQGHHSWQSIPLYFPTSVSNW